MAGPASSSSDPILSTKIQVPRLRPQRVERSRLSARLEQGVWGRLTLVCAPAGFGKTTLLADWARQSSRLVAWLALDDGDNIPDRFFTYLVAALARALPEVGQAALAMLRAPQPVQPEALVASLINDLAGAQPAVLVIDDYHLIQAQPIHAAVEYLIDHLPDSLHLVVAGRADPPLSLARLRARGELNELRGPELRFNTQETADFLNQVMGLALSAAEVEALEARTEGWIAGLQLAALSMQDRKDVDRFIKVFTGSHRYILDYLVEEVLRRQPEEIQTFLLQTSILERLCAPLCDAVTKDEGSRLKDEEDSSAFILQPSSFILDHLERSNLFLIPLDDERIWYRYHTLFADLLRYRLEQTLPSQVEGLHRRAAAWYQANELPMEAVAHWIAAKDWSQAARQVHAAGEDLLNHGRGSAFMGWLDRLPAQVFEALPRLHLLYAWALLQISQFARLEARLQEAERAANVRLQEAGTDAAADRPEMRLLMGEITATRAIMASMGGDMARVIQLSEQALADLPADHHLRCTVSFGLGIARLLDGETRQAERAFAEAARIAQQTGQLAAAATILANLGDAWMLLGNLEQAEQAYIQAVSLAPKENQTTLPVASMGYAGLAYVQREKGNLSLAREHILKAIELDEQWGNRDIHTINLARLAQVYFSCGEVEAGWEALDRAAENAREQPLTAMARNGFDTIYTWACQFYGRPEAAWQWAQEYAAGPALPGFPGEAGLLAWAEVGVARGRSAHEPALLQEARERLEGLLPALRESRRNGFRLTACLQLALACSGLSDEGAACLALEEALDLAAGQGYQAVFLDRGPGLEALLVRAQASTRHPETVKSLLAAFARAFHTLPAARPTPTMGEASGPGLSARELEVLRLVVQGQSNPEIAARLVLSPGTVKRHLHNIFEKLEVTTRPQAIARARQLGLG